MAYESGDHSDRKIIIAYDGSENSKDGLKLGGQLCRALDAVPVVVFCVTFPKYLIDPLELGLAMDEVGRPVIEEARYALGMDNFESRKLLEKSPARAISMLAEEINPVAIVIGSAHSGVLGRVRIGRVGKQLLSGASCAVSVAPRGYADNRREEIASIGIALDEGVESESALIQASTLALNFSVPLSIVNVMEPITYASVPMAALADIGLVRSRYTAQMLEDAADRVREGIEVTIDRQEGEPGPVLADYSRRIDLMVLGSRGFGPFRRVLLGSVSSYLMSHAHCPLLITPRGVAPGVAGKADSGLGADRPRSVR